MLRKIFLSFWLTVIVAGLAFHGASVALRQVGTPAVTSRQATYLVLGVILLLGGVVCFVLARHFATPLTQLGAAANAVADGRLETRLPGHIGERHDEVGALARDFNRMAGRIEALVAGERRLLGEVSHELRSPLARMTVALTLARRQPDPAEYLDRIEREAQRLDLLVGQLLTLARIESGVEIARSEVDFTAIVQEIVSDGDFEARASERRVVLAAADAATLPGNAELLRSAIENVVRNAIRHTATGTTVEVALRAIDGRIALTVRDHGDGLADEILDHLFEPFRSASGSAGLGLAITERVVRMHGGSIEAMNAEGGGVVVRITLPSAL